MSAKQELESFIEKSPQESEPIFLLAKMLLNTGEWNAAVPLLEQCVSLMLDNPMPNLMLAQLKSETGNVEKATYYYQKLIERFPQYAHGYFSFAGLQQSVGALSSAKKLLRKTIEIDAEHCAALLALTLLVDSLELPKLETTMLALLTRLEAEQIKLQSDKSHSSMLAKYQQDIMMLNYALGYCNDKNNHYSEAFNYWQAANKIQLSFCDFKVSQMRPFFTVLKESFKRIDFESENKKESANRFKSNVLTPIFIVGLPRTGSTLLEKMLSNHSMINSAGEVNILSNEVVQKLQGYTQKNYPLDVADLSTKQREQLGELYLEKLRQHHPESRFIIDKLPANFQSIGLIKLILPHAIIVHLGREPEAVALSIFSNYFAANEPYFCDLNELADYMGFYRNLMSFWQENIPNAYLDLSYKELVESPNATVQKILDICQLEWEDCCVSSQLNSEQVSTLSSIQVRKPLYQTSIDKWQPYSDFLGVITNVTNL